MDDKQIEDQIVYPPLIGVRDSDALCPPTDPTAYMQWLADNPEARCDIYQVRYDDDA